jgi:hypothetical protein
VMKLRRKEVEEGGSLGGRKLRREEVLSVC